MASDLGYGDAAPLLWYYKASVNAGLHSAMYISWYISLDRLQVCVVLAMQAYEDRTSSNLLISPCLHVSSAEQGLIGFTSQSVLELALDGFIL